MSIVLLPADTVEQTMRPKLDTLAVLAQILEAADPGTLAGDRAVALYAEAADAALEAALDLLGVER